MLDLALAPSVHQPVKPDEELIEGERFVLFMNAGKDARSASVERLRATPDSLPEVVESVRALLRARARAGATWEFHEDDELVAAARALGMQPATPPTAALLGMGAAPAIARSGVVVTPVETLEEYKVHVRITHEVFGMEDRLAASLAGIDAHGREDLADQRFIRYVARLEGEPCGAATATFTAAGVMLHSGSTLATHRGRGVYSAMVAHRWGEAVRRGTPRLVTRAGVMSRPILARLGFTDLGTMHFLVDLLEPPSA